MNSTEKGDMLKLGDYASIRTGLVLSRKKASPDDGKPAYRVLNLRNITDGGEILLPDIEDYYASEILKKEYFTRDGDVIFRLSAPYTAVFITKNETNLLIPAHFAIIRPDKTLNSQYLHWWLTKNKRLFVKMASGGSMMGTISSGYISDIAFAPPPLEKQKQIARFLEMSNREQHLLTELSEKKKRLATVVLKKIIGEES